MGNNREGKGYKEAEECEERMEEEEGGRIEGKKTDTHPGDKSLFFQTSGTLWSLKICCGRLLKSQALLTNYESGPAPAAPDTTLSFHSYRVL